MIDDFFDKDLILQNLLFSYALSLVKATFGKGNANGLSLQIFQLFYPHLKYSSVLLCWPIKALAVLNIFIKSILF